MWLLNVEKKILFSNKGTLRKLDGLENKPGAMSLFSCRSLGTGVEDLSIGL